MRLNFAMRSTRLAILPGPLTLRAFLKEPLKSVNVTSNWQRLEVLLLMMLSFLTSNE